MKTAKWLTSAQRTAHMTRFHSDIRGRGVVEHEARETERIRNWLKKAPGTGLLVDRLYPPLRSYQVRAFSLIVGQRGEAIEVPIVARSREELRALLGRG